jgi:hypothetical protein
MKDEFIVLKRIKLPDFPPETKARLEIGRLASNPDLQSVRKLGGPTPPEVLEEQRRREVEFQRRKLAIIKKYDVAPEYLTPLLKKEARLKSELSKTQEEIAALRNL